MTIFLVSSPENKLDFFPELADFLGEEISESDVQSYFAPMLSDIPMTVNEIIGSAEIVFVFIAREKNNPITGIVIEKLIDLELKHGIKIVKAVEEINFEELDESELEEEKDRLAEKWGKHVLRVMFEPESFALPVEEQEEAEEE